MAAVCLLRIRPTFFRVLQENISRKTHGKICLTQTILVAIDGAEHRSLHFFDNIVYFYSKECCLLSSTDIAERSEGPMAWVSCDEKCVNSPLTLSGKGTLRSAPGSSARD